MSQSPPSDSMNLSLLFGTGSVLFYGTRWLIFGLSIVGVVSTLSDQYMPYAWLFGFMCPFVATLIWQVATFSPLPPDSKSAQTPKGSPWLVVPIFWLPIIDHIAYPVKQFILNRSRMKKQSKLGVVDARSLVPTSERVRIPIGNIQNHVVIALVTTCCQVYSVVVHML